MRTIAESWARFARAGGAADPVTAALYYAGARGTIELLASPPRAGVGLADMWERFARAYALSADDLEAVRAVYYAGAGDVIAICRELESDGASTAAIFAVLRSLHDEVRCTWAAP